MKCERCGGELVAREEARSVSAAGLVGALIAFAGIVALFASPLVGIGLILLGAILGSTMRKKRLSLVCAKCGAVTKVA